MSNRNPFDDIFDRQLNTQPGGADSPSRNPFDTLMGSGAGSRYPLSYSESQGLQNQGLLGRAGQVGLDALHTIAPYLEPVQLPQDALFALLAGARDPHKSIWEYMQEINVGAYAPGGASPGRPIHGRELLQIYGVQNESALKWGGFTLDLVADPLLAGTALKIVGSASRASGMTRFGNQLIETGRRVDSAMTPGALYRAVPEVARVRVENSLVRGLEPLLNFRPAHAFGDAPEARTIFDMIAPQSRARAVMALNAADSTGTPIRLDQAMDMARDITKAEQLGQQRALDIELAVFNNLDEVQSLLGERATKGMLSRMLQGAGRALGVLDDVERVPVALRDAMMTTASDFIDRTGTALVSRVLPNTLKSEVPVIREAMEQLRAVRREVSQTMPNRVMETVVDFQASVHKIRDLALRNTPTGRNPVEFADEMEGVYRQVTEKFAQSEALIGLELSGFPLVKEKFIETVLRAGASSQVAHNMWREVMRTGMTGGDVKTMPLSQFGAQFGNVGQTLQSMRQVGSGRQAFNTVGDILDTDALFTRLDINTFMKSLQEGHLKRVYGLFQDGETFARYQRGLENGKFLPFNSIIDESILPQTLDARGFRHEGELLAGYLRGVSQFKGAAPQQGRRIDPRGFLIQKDRLVEHLMENGISPQRAAQAIDEMILHSNPGLSGLIQQRAADIAASQRSSVSQRQGLGNALQSRHDIDRNTLDLLGELANPIVSLSESTRYATRAIPVQMFMKEIGDLARKNGLVDNVSRPGWKRLPDDPLLGPLKREYVHPLLEKEIFSAFRNAEHRPGILGRLRSLVTGSFLMGPNIILANLIGGQFTAAGLGVGPQRLIPAMASSLQDFARVEKKQGEFFDYEMLRQRVSLQDASMAGHIIRDAKKLPSEMAGLGPEGYQKTLQNMGDWLWNQMQAPLGIRSLGLDGFQFSEILIKTGVFRAEKTRLLRDKGLPEVTTRAEYQALPDNIRYQVDQVFDEAGQTARFSTFDYSELPQLLKWGRDYGMTLFPGFNYFLAGRIIGAGINNPATLAVSDRISEAITNVVIPDPEEQARLFAALPDWLREDQGIPIGTREDGTYRVIPFNQLIPTNVFSKNPLSFFNPFGESMAQGGLWGPVIDMLSAHLVTKDGKAPLGQRFGGQVFSAGADGTERFFQTVGFIHNSYAPGFVKKLISYNPNSGPTGILPQIRELGMPVPEELARAGITLREYQRGRKERDLTDSLIGAVGRSVTPVATGGTFPNINREYASARRELNQELAVLRTRIERAMLLGDQQEAQRLRVRAQAKIEKFRTHWTPIAQAYRK